MNVFQMSISASILILIIIIIRALAIHKLPKKTFLILWSVVLFRLLIPFSIPSHFSIFPPVDKVMEGQIIAPAAKTFSPAAAINFVIFIWVMGITACALFFLITHLRCRREYKAALPVDNNYVNGWLQERKTRRSIQIKQLDRINAPMTYGTWRPVILLPKTTDWRDETQLRYVLTHEMTHIKRFDIILKWLLATALCIHWFNPLIWVMYILANRDIELSCDETVVRTLGETVKSAYALALINLEEKKSVFSPFCNNFSKNAIEERITAIMKIKKISFKGILLTFALITGAATCVFATSATAQSKNESEPVTESSVNLSIDSDESTVNQPEDKQESQQNYTETNGDTSNEINADTDNEVTMPEAPDSANTEINSNTGNEINAAR